MQLPNNRVSTKRPHCLCYAQVHSEQKAGTAQCCEISVPVSYPGAEAANGQSSFLRHPLEKAWALSNTRWDVALRAGSGQPCSSVDSMSTHPTAAGGGQVDGMGSMGCCSGKIFGDERVCVLRCQHELSSGQRQSQNDLASLFKCLHSGLSR